ncbi:MULTISPECIES: hypothetical protein [Lysinibacillus]|jgi:hypothetical protein|uniref:Cytochrome-c oxidase n=1 Tax=Lysinibacillus fusiformis TaxID=28031 RepID=A0A2I0UW28_9BACI|nr:MULTISPECIES: hypothetical protein [Lysinibacillus]KUF35611.1 hypothetical protein AK833_06865 [Lysinibacillus sp. F5]MEE3808935.1 hypothetical protein [Lysinibacillus fusiformis]PKU50251.1 hypothetical protein CRI88_19140 [Lysinibacillus fusiformis]WCH47942.1 hypothetical protein NV349_00675 [Lysinibacillus sp. OF-1]SCY90612.1 hypothetical protein SAMN02787078_02961 [Lysinibacillus sp. SG9]
MEQKWSIRLIRLAAIFAFIGTYLGSHMSGSGSYEYRPIHAHILLVGWLSMFAWGIFYRAFKVKSQKLVAIHGWTAILGVLGLTVGMWFYNINPFNFGSTFTLIFFIVGGTTLLISFALFIIVTFMIHQQDYIKS